MSPDFSRILVIRGAGALGDVVLSLPVLDALRAAYPDAHIEIAGTPSMLEIARPVADSIVSPPEGFWTIFSDDADVPDELAAYLDSFELVVFFASQDHISVAVLKTLCREIVAIEPLPSEGVHACDWFLSALRPMGIRGSAVPRVRPDAEADREADALCREYGLEEFPCVIGYAPGSGSPKKNWPEEMFVETIRVLGEETPSGVIEILGPAESGEGPPSTEARQAGGMVARNLSLPVLAGLLRRCAVYIGNDSGVTHLAAAAGTPTTALFGPTDPSVWGPRGERVAIVAPMDSIDLAEVVAVARTLRTAAMCEALA